MRKVLLAGAVSLALSGAAAADIVESEPNNDFDSADVIVRGDPSWADVGIMRLGAQGEDVDYFSIRLRPGEIITIVTTPMEDPFVVPDTLLALFDSDRSELAFNDDGGAGFGSVIRYVVEEEGTYFIAVTGFGDRDFNGTGHDEVGRYALTVSIVIPAPAGLAVLAAGGIALGRRRRRR